MGDAAQKRWARILARRGNAALPVYGMEDTDAATKAPILFVQDGLLVTPDILVINEKLRVTWHEVKAKTVPGWYRNRGRWEHGLDYSILLEYQEVERVTGFPVWVIVYEERSPEDPNSASRLVSSGLYLGATLDQVVARGERRPTWPGGRNDKGRRGRRGEGGWLWPRSIMVALEARREPIERSACWSHGGPLPPWPRS